MTRSAANSASSSQAVRTLVGVADGLDFGERFEAYRESTTVDRVRIDDEELQTIPACSSAPPWRCCPPCQLAPYYAGADLMESAVPQIRNDRDVSRCRKS